MVLVFCRIIQPQRIYFRFEGVHPNIYSIYNLLQGVADLDLQNQIREHLIKIEGIASAFWL